MGEGGVGGEEEGEEKVMTIATSSAEEPNTGSNDKSRQPTSVGGGDAGIFSNSGTPIKKSADTPFEYTNLLGLPERISGDVEVRRSLPIKECAFCKREWTEGSRRPYPARRTAWIYREKGWFMWYRVCFNHMTTAMRQAIEEMYSR